MKRHYYNSLSEFYGDVKNVIRTEKFDHEANSNDPSFKGLHISEIQESKFSYKFGVEKLRNFKDFEVEKDIKIKYWDQFDGYDIDIDRMHGNLDFLLNHKRVRKLPKTMDVFVNIAENSQTKYDQMLHKTYAALKVVDRLESLGVRTAVYACISLTPLVRKKYTEDLYMEICIKQHADTVNLGALCTAISPWFFRHWLILWMKGRYPGLDSCIGTANRIPTTDRQKGITIDKGFCLDQYTSQRFVENVKIEES
jgi:hypothetical protein